LRGVPRAVEQSVVEHLTEPPQGRALPRRGDVKEQGGAEAFAPLPGGGATLRAAPRAAGAGSLFRPRITLSGNLAAFHFVVLSSHDAAIVGRVAPLGQGERHFLSPIPVKNCRRDEQSHLKLPLSIHLRALSHPCHTRVAGPPAAGFIVSPDSPKASLIHSVTRQREPYLGKNCRFGSLMESRIST